MQDPAYIGSYSQSDVIFVLKEIGDLLAEQGTEDREEAIQNGIHYSEMLPIEYAPSQQYIDLFYQSLEKYAEKIAVATGVVASQIYERKQQNVVLVSLARAGTPIGILIKRYLSFKYHVDVPHYSVSIIRGKGIDEQAIQYILQTHPDQHIQFVDGWTGKGAIAQELERACQLFNKKYGTSLNSELAVLADPGHCAPIYGTREDFLIPSACLNATVSGLLSRTVHNEQILKETDFHGVKFYQHLAAEDVSNYFIDQVVDKFSLVEAQIAAVPHLNEPVTWRGLADLHQIKQQFQIEDINLVKPGVGETTRVLLRRVPWKVLVKNIEDPQLAHIQVLARERNVPIEEYRNMSYTCCGLIKPLPKG